MYPVYVYRLQSRIDIDFVMRRVFCNLGAPPPKFKITAATVFVIAAKSLNRFSGGAGAALTGTTNSLRQPRRSGLALDTAQNSSNLLFGSLRTNNTLRTKRDYEDRAVEVEGSSNQAVKYRRQHVPSAAECVRRRRR